MRLYNSLTKQTEVVEPIRPGEIRMYVCGLTVSDDAHLGHGRSAAIFDLLRRVLRARGLRVVYVRNITDVDDKIIARAQALGRDPNELARSYIARHEEDMERLRVPRSEIEPRASEHIPEMIDFIGRLMDGGATYVKDGAIRFRLASDPEFGRLARATDAKVESKDFILWKGAPESEPGWDSPWGYGRPGWHIECSAMAAGLLGETFDIHGGGMDLIHPHHDAEIAQSHARFGKVPAKVFIHNGLVFLAEEKMSKSIGNFFTLRELFARYDPAAIRYYLFGTRYREPMQFTMEALEEAEGAVARIAGFSNASQAVLAVSERSRWSEAGKQLAADAKAARASFLEALEDDLDTPRALEILNDLIAKGEHYLATSDPDPGVLGEVEEVLDFIDEILDLRPERARTESRVADLIEAILGVRRRLTERASEDESAGRTARELTETLRSLGIEVVDTRWGTRWRWE
jgi:cysteinyl-tRNA synthetase